MIANATHTRAGLILENSVELYVVYLGGRVRTAVTLIMSSGKWSKVTSEHLQR
jgi:hypothetical protein